MYEEKAKFHEKLGAKRFQKVVGKVDNTKYKLLNKLGEERVLPMADKLINMQYKRYFEAAQTEEENRLLEEDYMRNKVLARKQIKIGRSINYYEGVDKRIALFPFYLESNKNVHQNALKVDGIVLGSGILLKELVSVVTPFLLPIPIIGTIGVPLLSAIPTLMIGYQIFAIPKNIQCINIQEYNLARMKAVEGKIVNRNMKQMKKQYDNNRQLIGVLKQSKQETGKPVTTTEDLFNFIDSIDDLNAILQLKAAIMPETRRAGENKGGPQTVGQMKK